MAIVRTYRVDRPTDRWIFLLGAVQEFLEKLRLEGYAKRMRGQVTSDVHLRAHACYINIYFLCATALSSPIITRCAYTIGRPRIQKLPDKRAREPIIRV